MTPDLQSSPRVALVWSLRAREGNSGRVARLGVPPHPACMWGDWHPACGARLESLHKVRAWAYATLLSLWRSHLGDRPLDGPGDCPGALRWVARRPARG